MPGAEHGPLSSLVIDGRRVDRRSMRMTVDHGVHLKMAQSVYDLLRIDVHDLERFDLVRLLAGSPHPRGDT